MGGGKIDGFLVRLLLRTVDLRCMRGKLEWTLKSEDSHIINYQIHIF